VKITCELRSYVASKLNELIPEPTSKVERDAIIDAANDARDDYLAFLNDKAVEYCSIVKTKYPCLADCEISYIVPTYHKPTLDINTSNCSAVKQYNEDYKDYNDFMTKAESKVMALLSVQKEVSDLDSFIVSVVSTIK
jgi:hypothetical protein